MDEIVQYLELIVEPTFADFKANPRSIRHAYLACVATYHAIDRAALPDKPGNLKRKWREQSLEFVIVDMMAHHLKHVHCPEEKLSPIEPSIPLSSLIFGEQSMDIRHLHFVIRDAIKFIRQQVGAKA